MPSGTSSLNYFLDAYLGVEPTADLDSALSSFAKEEGSEKVGSLRRELEALFKDPSADQLAAAISTVGRYAVKPDVPPAVFLVRLFERSQLVGPSEPYRRPFDAFIAYSHSDAVVAKKLAAELHRAGFKAWLDERESFAGHDIVDEVFRGIGASDFLLVLLSKAAVASKWVRSELNAAFLKEMERQQVVVIPVRLEECDVPEHLKAKKYADLATSWDDGIRYILASLEWHRANRALRDLGREPPGEKQTTNLMGFYKRAVEDVGAVGWPPEQAFKFQGGEEAYKDVAIGPLDGGSARLPKEELRETMRSCRVELQNWGGESFPYDEMPGANITPLSNGIRLVDKQTWPFSDWSFYYWRFEENALFAQRSFLFEDHPLEPRAARRVLFAEWVVKDICVPLMFAHRLSLALGAPTAFGVHFEWFGMKDRSLESFSAPRLFSRSAHVASEDRFRKTVVVERESNLLEIATTTIGDAVWLFGMEKFRDSYLAGHVSEILAGRFPR